MKLNFLLQFIILLFLAACNGKTQSLIPREALFFGDNSDKELVRLSPNGVYLSYITPINKVSTVCFSAIHDIHNKGLNARKCLKPHFDKGIRGYMWAYDNKHIIYSQDPDGSENTGLYIYNVNTEKYDTIFAKKGIKAAIAGVSSNKPDQVLIATNEHNKKYFDIYNFNIDKFEKTKSIYLELIFKNDKFTSLVYDRDFNLRFASWMNSVGGRTIFKYSDGKFQTFLTLDPDDSESFYIAGFNKNNSKIYIFDGRNSDTDNLKELNLDTNETKVIINEQKADLDIMTTSPIEKNIQAVRVNYTIPQTIIIDDSIKGDINFLKRLNKGVFNILSRTTDDKLWLIVCWNDTMPGEYYIYDRSKKTIKFLFKQKPNLASYRLASMQPIIIKSRDGLDLVSYITLPNKAIAPYPLVVHVHGGPAARDIWGCNVIHQWLANRGYAVLSTNFRGSSGFGKKFLNAGNREWSKKMHQDIIDAVNWTITHKIADPNKIAIMGGSYGGYETLVALTRNPDLFACGIDIVGPSDLATLIKSVPEYWKPISGNFRKKVGDIDSLEGLHLLSLSSPINFADKITKPLLIAQGANDPRVTREQSDRIVEILQKKKIPVLYALYLDEGHGFRNVHNRLSFYAIVEQFLAKVLGGKAEPIGNSLHGINFMLNGKENKNSHEAEMIINQSINFW